MPNVVTETATFDAPLSVPADGDVENAASVTAANTGFQALADRTQYLIVEAQGQQIGNSSIFWNTTDQLFVSHRQMVLSDGTSARWLDVSGTINVSGLSASTWYYIYAYTTDLSTVTLEYSTTVPVNLQYKTGFPTHRYLGCFVTDTGPHVVPFYMARGHYVFLRSAMPVLVNDFTLDHTKTTFQTVDLSQCVPPHSIMADIRLRMESQDTVGITTCRLRTYNITTTYTSFFVGQSPGGGLDVLNDTGIPFCVASQKVEYEFAASITNAIDSLLTIEGFYE